MAEHRLRHRQLVRFVAVGGGAAALFFLLALAFDLTGIARGPGNVLAYFIAFVVAYSAQQRWTFGGTTPHRQALPRYITVQLICAGLTGLLGHIAEAKSLDSVIAAALATIAASAASFILSSRWAFRRPTPSAR